MYEIEFYDETTIEGIISSFNNLNEAGIESYIIINGVTIFGNEINFEEKVRQEYKKYKEKKKLSNKILKQEHSNNVEDKKQDDEFSENFKNRNDLYFLSQDSTFLFEIGVVLQYTKEEYKEELLNYYISAYGYSSKNKSGIELTKNLGYISNLLLIMEDDTLIEKYFKIQQIINCISNSEDEKYKFETAIKIIENYTIHGEKIRELLFLDILKDKLSEENNKLNKILKHTIF